MKSPSKICKRRLDKWFSRKRTETLTWEGSLNPLLLAFLGLSHRKTFEGHKTRAVEEHRLFSTWICLHAILEANMSSYKATDLKAVQPQQTCFSAKLKRPTESDTV